MRIRTGHGPDDWTPSIPAEPLNPKGWFGGSMVVSAPRPAKEASRQTSRRYSAAHPDRRAESQRQYRARIRTELAALRSEGAS